VVQVGASWRKDIRLRGGTEGEGGALRSKEKVSYRGKKRHSGLMLKKGGSFLKREESPGKERRYFLEKRRGLA